MTAPARPHLAVVPAGAPARCRVVPVPEPETRWFGQLRRHFTAGGCCYLCAVYYGLQAIEREARRLADAPAPACPRTFPSCAELARKAWASRPRRTP